MRDVAEDTEEMEEGGKEQQPATCPVAERVHRRIIGPTTKSGTKRHLGFHVAGYLSHTALGLATLATMHEVVQHSASAVHSQFRFE